MPILDSHVARYLRDLEPLSSGVMLEIEDAARREKMPRLPWATARFIAALVRARDPLRILELGTGFGYTTLHMAEALGQGRIVTIERDRERAERARGYFERAGVGARIEIAESDVSEALQHLEGPFDLVLIDGARVDAPGFLRLVEPLLSSNALALIPATLLWGLIATEHEPDAFWGPELEVTLVSMARALNAELVSSDRWLGSLLPVGGGLAFAVRR